MSTAKVLFILKRRADFDPAEHSVVGMQTGLYNSANYMHEMLTNAGVDTKIVVVIDNNCIDREVSLYRPTHVIIEALWVVPTKFAVLTKLHPTVKWIIRLHSDLPFLSQEGMSFDWIGDYASYPNVIVAANAPRMFGELREFIGTVYQLDEHAASAKVAYLPNCYPTDFKQKTINYNKPTVDVGCFGAVRPLKNHATQAMGALKFANLIGKKLRFHINARVEGRGDAVVNSLKGMFQHLANAGHELIFHTWAPREQFLELCATMDIGMQVSFSETFNIVAADLVSQGVPIIGSDELPWTTAQYDADPTNSTGIADTLVLAYHSADSNVATNQHLLAKYTAESQAIWIEYLVNTKLVRR